MSVGDLDEGLVDVPASGQLKVRGHAKRTVNEVEK